MRVLQVGFIAEVTRWLGLGLWWPVLISGLSVPAASGFTRLVNSPRVPMGHFFPRISLRIHHNGKSTDYHSGPPC